MTNTFTLSCARSNDKSKTVSLRLRCVALNLLARHPRNPFTHFSAPSPHNDTHTHPHTHSQSRMQITVRLRVRLYMYEFVRTSVCTHCYTFVVAYHAPTPRVRGSQADRLIDVSFRGVLNSTHAHTSDRYQQQSQPQPKLLVLLCGTHTI